MQQDGYRLKVPGVKIHRWLLIILMSCILMTPSGPVGAGDIRWNFLFTLQFLENHRDEIIQAIIKLLGSRQNVVMNSERYHRMIVMCPREEAQVQQNTVRKQPSFRESPKPAMCSLSVSSRAASPVFTGNRLSTQSLLFPTVPEPLTGMQLDDTREFLLETGLEFVSSHESQPDSLPLTRGRSEMRFFIERDFADEIDSETSSVATDGRSSGTPDVYGVSPLGRSPLRLTSMDTGQLYDQSEARRLARARRRTPLELDVRDDVDVDDSPAGWFIRDKVYDCKRLDLFNKGKFGSAYKEYAHRRCTQPTSPEPANRSADFAEVFMRVIDDPSVASGIVDRAYINDDLLCIVADEAGMFFELCVKFNRYKQLSLFRLSNDDYSAYDPTDQEQKEYEDRVDRFLEALESVAQSELFNECDQQLVDVPFYGKVLANCVGRGQCKVVLEFPELFPGLAFSWQRGHSRESAQLLDGLQGASLTVYEEIAKGLDPQSQALIDTDQIRKADHESIESTRMPSVYRSVPAADGSTTVVEIQHRIPPDHLAQTYITLALTQGLDFKVPIKIQHKNQVPSPALDDHYGAPAKSMDVMRIDELMSVPVREILYSIFESLIADLVQFTGTLEAFRSLKRIPVAIGVDSKLPNYRVSFYLGRGGSLRADLKNFDNEPPNLKIFKEGEPLYRGGPLYDSISKLFPGSRLQENFVDRVQKITEFRSLLVKLLAGLAADYLKYQQVVSFDFQWFIDRVNQDVQNQEVSEKPITWEEIDTYMQRSKKSHRAFRLYVWVCQLAASLLPGRFTMPPAYIPVDHEQKQWLDTIKQQYQNMVAGLILLNQFDELDRLLQVILNEQINLSLPQPVPSSQEMSWLSFYLSRMKAMQSVIGSRFSSWMGNVQQEVPELPALETVVDDFLHSSAASVESELFRGYQYYCNWAYLPVLNHAEHYWMHEWWQVWRWVRFRCGSASRHLEAPSMILAPGESAEGVAKMLQQAWKGTLQIIEFSAPQAAVGQLFGLSQDRVRALIHRLLNSGQIPTLEDAYRQLGSLQHWFDNNYPPSQAEPYTQLAQFSGFFLKDAIHIFEFVNGLLTGITIVGMRYDSSGNLVEYQEFIPQSRVDLSRYAPGRRRQGYYLFHNQASPFFVSGGDSWHSVGLPVAIPETTAEELDQMELPALLQIPDAQFHIDPDQLNHAANHDQPLLQKYIDYIKLLFLSSRFQMVGVAGDNACLFNAVAYALSKILNKPVTPAKVKTAIKRLLAKLKHKVQLNYGAISNDDPNVIEPYTPEEKFLLNFLGGQLDLLDAEINVEGVWNDYTMIILAANAFHTPVHFVAPPVTPITQAGHEQPNIMEVSPGQEPVQLQQLPHGPVVFFNGAVHWDVAVPLDGSPGRSLLESVFSQKLQQYGLAATLTFIQVHLSKGASHKQ